MGVLLFKGHGSARPPVLARLSTSFLLFLVASNRGSCWSVVTCNPEHVEAGTTRTVVGFPAVHVHPGGT
eukprot:6135612-Prorocentrum_lima.AAC.1